MRNFLSYGNARTRLFSIVLMMLIAILFPGARACGQELEKKVMTRHAIIHYRSGEDLLAFTRKIGGMFSFLIDRSGEPGLAASRVDKIAAEVGALLGIPVLNLRFSVYVFKGQKELDERYAALTGKRGAPAAFYDHRTKSIIVSLSSVSKNILAHEIAHALICASFSVPPPAPLQEILARYVDEHLSM